MRHHVERDDLFSAFEYSFDRDNIQFCNKQHFEIEKIDNVNDCLNYIDENFAEGMKYIYCVEDSGSNYFTIRLRYTDLQDEYEKGNYEEYVFSV